MSNDLMPTKPTKEIQVVQDAVPVLDSSRFEHMQRIAMALARSSMVPETLRTVGTKENKQDLPPEQVLSNCFLVVNQAVRWNMDPFAVLSCCSVVHGRLAYEGKLVAAVLESKLGIQLHYDWNDKTGDNFGITVSGKLPDGRIETVEGTVGQWKTTGPGSPWFKQPKLQLAYRGAREWARLYAPGVMLGVYSEDELADLREDARARRATPVVSLAERFANAKTLPSPEGFSAEHVEREIGSSPSIQPETEAEVMDTEPESVTVESTMQDSNSADTEPQDERAGDDSVPPSVVVGASPELLLGYSRALHRAGKKDSLKTAATAFWKTQEVKATDLDPGSREKLGKIWAAHEERIDGKLAGPALDKRVKAIIEGA